MSILRVPRRPSLNLHAKQVATSSTAATGPSGSNSQLFRRHVKTPGSGITQRAPLSRNYPEPPLFQVLASSDIFAPDFQPYSEAPNAHFSLPVKVQTAAGWKDTVALVDSGATHNFIDSDFSSMHSLPSYPMSRPTQLLMADGKESQGGLVSHEASLTLAIEPHTERLKFSVTKLGGRPMILGIPWLKQHDPYIC